MKVKKVLFEDILPYWQILWPNRKSKIQPMSSMRYKSGYDLNIYNLYTPTFFALFLENDIIGVNSGHKTSENYYRSRGLWIDPEYRGNNFSNFLLEAVNNQAVLEKSKYIWTIPRKSALKSYKKNGFIKTSDFFDRGVEFGPNCYALKEL